MMYVGALPLSGLEADLLFVELNEELFRLEEDLARFHELEPGRRLPTPDAYREQIRVRRELLRLLESMDA